jgi:hypothetical protein
MPWTNERRFDTLRGLSFNRLAFGAGMGWIWNLKRIGRAWPAVASGAALYFALGAAGCASRQRTVEQTSEQAAEENPRAENFGRKMRDKGTDTLPFWYSDKSKDIARNLGSGD